MKKLITIFALLVLIPSIFILSCKKDKNDDVTPINTSTCNINIVGTVVDINMNPIQGVSVKIGSKVVTTDYYGSYFFSNISVPKSRFVIEYAQTGYFSLSRSAIPESGANMDIEVGLISESGLTYAGSKNFSSTTADSLVLPSDCRIIFPANAFVTSSGAAFSGTVTVKAAYLDPTMQNYPMFAFGGDLYGKDNAGNSVMLNPYTGLTVVMTDGSGNKLQLDAANSKKSTVKMTIPTGLVAFAPDSISLMDYNTTEGLCYASGTATKSGNKYMGQVGHFSYWSCQKLFTGKATVSGTVTDYNGNPVAGVRVHIGRAVGMSSVIAITDIDGHYSRVIPAGLAGVVGIFPTYFGTTITPQSFTALSDGGSFTADFSVPHMRKVTGKLVNCTGTVPVRGPVTLTWYSYSSYTNVHASCFAKPDGTFRPMELSATSGTIHAWGNDTNQVITISPTSDPYDAGNIILCPPIVTGANQFTLTGDTFATPTTFYLTSNKVGYLIYDTITGTPKFIMIQGYGTGEMYINVNGTTTGTYPIHSPTRVFLYLMNPFFQDTLKTGSVKITRLDPVGGLIEGTYSGSTGTVSLTNGVFSVARTANQ